MTESHRQEDKVQPWRILVSDKPYQEETRDICHLTDRPWARQALAEGYSNIVHDERQHRYSGYDKYRQPDPFKGIYKAESAPINSLYDSRETDGATDVHAKRLADCLRRAGGKD